MNKNIFIKAAALSMCLVMSASLVSCGSKKTQVDETTASGGEITKGSVAEEESEEEIELTTYKRVSLLSSFTEDSAVSYTASVKEPGITDVSTAVNAGAFYLSDEAKQKLLDNGFYVTSGGNYEFYQRYENNRYNNVANFVTVDSMMHAYHMYFSYLLKNTERNYLSSNLLSLSQKMLAISKEQYETLKGSAFEDAALRNVAFFTIGAVLLDSSTAIDSSVEGVVQMEIDDIMAASGIVASPLTGVDVDYSQFQPRGYYEGDEALEKYFRAMMWYGQIGFEHKDEDLDKCALLISIGLNNDSDANALWTSIYAITTFFAGESDDLTYYEYYAAAEAAYGQGVAVSDIAGKDDEWTQFRDSIDTLRSPAINSASDATDGESSGGSKGFRFMGQRFSIDSNVLQQLIYSNVGSNSQGENRMLPDTLDVCAAFGSDLALEILDQQGDTDYSGYSENMEELRADIEQADDYVWSSSLYNAWLYTLTPLLSEKGEGYPTFMQNQEWQKKNLESFASSYAELKHDTVLYAKQAMAEMGGDTIPDWDTRGYVEPEVEVWSRFALMAQQTAQGLSDFGMIAETDYNNLIEMADLAKQFEDMSVKELQGELLTDEEYEVIEYYGGDLEHLWEAALADEGGTLYVANYPAAIITDIATDPNGYCLEVGTGRVSQVVVLVYFDGAYHLCSGSAYSFYQFEQSTSDRLTDSSWRQLIGVAQGDDGQYNRNSSITQPEWTLSYRLSN